MSVIRSAFDRHPLCLAAVGYLLLTPLMVWPLTALPRIGTATYGGDALLNAWALAWNNHVVLDGARSYFDANIFHPTPGALARSEHLFGIGLFTLPLYAATRNALLTYDIAWLISFPAAGVAAFALASLTARHFVSRFVAGIVYAFACFRMQHAVHLQLLWTFGLPLSLLALNHWHRRQSWPSALTWGAVLTLQALSSWYLAVLSLASNAMWLLWLLVLSPRRRTNAHDHAPTRTSMLAAAWSNRPRATPLLTAITLSAVALYGFGRAYAGAPLSTSDELLANSASWSSYLVPPRWTSLGQILLARDVHLPALSFETHNFLGVIPTGLSVIAVAALMTRRYRHRAPERCALTFAIALGVVAGVLSFGPDARGTTGGSAYAVISQLPGMSSFRVPARFALLVVLAMAILSAAGADVVASARRGSVVLWTLVPLLLLETYPAAYQLGRPQQVTVPKVYAGVSRLPAGPLVSLPAFTEAPWDWAEAEYLLFSTLHWNPVMNGYSRSQPAEHRSRMAVIASFPSDDAIDELRRQGVVYVVLHARRHGVDLRAAAAAAMRHPALTLLARDGEDYVWRVEDVGVVRAR